MISFITTDKFILRRKKNRGVFTLTRWTILQPEYSCHCLLQVIFCLAACFNMSIKYEVHQDKNSGGDKTAIKNEPPHDKTNNSPSLIRVFAVHMKKAWVLSYPLSTQRRLWSDWVDAQAELSLRWAHSHFVGFVTRQLKLRAYITL